MTRAQIDAASIHSDSAPYTSRDGTGTATVAEQGECCFETIRAILSGAGMGFVDVMRLGAFVTRRQDIQGYMRVRDRYVGAPPPASTLVIVAGFTRPEFLVEVEAVAAGAD